MNLKIKTVYLHVGMYNIATTNIQENLCNNVELLKKKGFYYFTIKKERVSIDFLNSIINDEPEKIHTNLKTSMNKKTYLKFNEKYKRIFEDEINNNKCENIIISSEDISSMTKINIENMLKFLKDLMPNAKIIIIFLTCERVSFLQSRYQEMIKLGSANKDFSEFYNLQRTLDIYKKRIEKFLELVGRPNILIYKFEDIIKHEYGILGFLLSNLEFSNEEIGNLIVVKSNESISNKAADILIYLNNILPLMKNNIINKGRSVDDLYPLWGISGRKFSLSPELQNKYKKIGKKDEIWLKENTGIDYTCDFEINEPEKMVFDKVYEKEMQVCLTKLSPVLKKIVLQYFEQKLKTKELDSRSKNTFENLVKYIKINFKEEVIELSLEEIIQLYEAKKLCRTFMNDLQQNSVHNDYYKEAEYYKEIATFCEKSNQIEAAVNFMEIAKKIRPFDGVIARKYKEYYKKNNEKMKQENKEKLKKYLKTSV